MKNIKRGLLGAVAAAALSFGSEAWGQTNLNFNGVTANIEGATRLSWNSTSNEIYEIDETDALGTNPDGTTTWNMLYSDYPSQGTNTFWLDTGNYFTDPEIVHPSLSPMRYYRIALIGTNGTTTVPTVAISSPTNGSILNGAVSVTVTAVTDQAFLSPKLYVDGQEMNDADVTTNWMDVTGTTNYMQATYVLNTCEWPNGPHILFATSKCQSGASGMTLNGSSVSIGYGVSGFVPVTFSNLITRVSFSQPFFAPEDGETQQVSAIFAANVNWTLQIQDVNSNSVRTVTGSGGTLSFGWNGTDDGGTNLPVGTYTYLITAETNGMDLLMLGGGSGSMASSSFASAAAADSAAPPIWWATASDGSGSAAPYFLFPSGVDTAGLSFFQAPATWGQSAELSSGASLSRGATFAALDSGGGVSSDYSGSSSQNSRSPQRPPIQPVRGRTGVYGIAYDTYSANGSGFSFQAPDNGLHIGQRIKLEGSSSTSFSCPDLHEYKTEANNFIAQMKKGNWSQGFARVDDKFTINDLRASGSNIFNTVKLGLLMLHGTYGTTLDFNANQTKQIYFPITAGHSAALLRANEMSLGNAATNGLQWMGILACNSMQHSSWSTMQTGGAVPYNGSLHLLLGSDSVIWTGDHVASYWAKYMTVGKTNNAPMTVETAWFTGIHDAYAESGFNYTNAMKLASSGDSACRTDTLSTSSSPGGSSFYNSQQVWP